MQSKRFVWTAVWLWIGTRSICGGQESPPASDEQSAPPVASAPAPAHRFGNILQFPGWLRVGFEFRARADMNRDMDQDEDDRLYLNRIRLAAIVQPARRVRFFVQGQDARAVSLRGGPVDDFRNAVELHQGYVEWGLPEQGWQLRFGRQEIAVGDERLVGADNYWDWFGQAFDAIHVSFVRSQWRADAFSGFRVEAADQRVNPFDTNSRIAGLTVTLKRDWGMVEPYVIWKRGNDIQDLMARQGHKDVAAPGVLARGDLLRRVDFGVEMVFERGHVVADSISAWAGHWEIGWRPWGKQSGPRLGFEYNYASGDPNPLDGRYQTFDDMYPAGYNKFGMMDPIAWRNIRYPFFSLEMPLDKHWKLLGGYRSYRLAQIRDGLYPGGDEFLTRYPEATSTHVGSQALVSAAYEASRYWRVYAGYGMFFAGPYLRENGFRTRLPVCYVQTSFSF